MTVPEEKRSSIEKGSAESHVENASTDKEEVLDFGGDSTLPPPPKYTEEEEAKLYRKLDIRRVFPSIIKAFT